MIEIVEYDPQWAKSFDELKNVLTDVLGNLAIRVEHVGSTAVPGLAAKPIIDIDVVIESCDLLPRAIQALSGVGYFHQGDLGIPGRESFKRSGPDIPRDGTGRSWSSHHLYVCDRDNRELHRQVVFRDFLRDHPDYAQRYAELKRGLACRHSDDRTVYTNGKTAFVSEVMLLISEKKRR